jgi:hypothetical protein
MSRITSFASFKRRVAHITAGNRVVRGARRDGMEGVACKLKEGAQVRDEQPK